MHAPRPFIFPGDDDPDASGAPQQPPPPEVASSSLTMPSDGDAPLPAVSKGAVLSAAASTGFWMGVLALLLRQYAQVRDCLVIAFSAHAGAW
jgi:hypothetical protein